MPKRRTASVKTYRAEGGADYGPALRPRADGRLVAWGGAAAIELETRDDPSIVDRRRPVRGARRRDVLCDLQARRVITKRMRDAAEQFLDDCSIASGGSAGDEIGMPGVQGPRVGLPERQVRAITRINAVRLALGLNNGTVFWWVIFDNRSLGDYETSYRLRTGTASELLRAALTALDQHYHFHSVWRSA